jgi:uncharacterized membrane protein
MMLSLVVASALLSSQPAGALQPLVVNLCNETPARIAYSVVYPAGARAQRRRGWLTVEPGACLSGAIGNTTGGEAFVHAMSGEYRWPSGDAGLLSCLPANSHDSLASTPPCNTGERQVALQAVSMQALRGRYQLDHTAFCSDLPASDQRWCETGRRDAQGFAEAVRTLQVCNQTPHDVRLAVAGEAPSGAGRRVEGWTALASGRCVEAWRGLSRENAVYVHSAGPVPMDAEADFARHCVVAGADFQRAVSAENQSSCADGETLVGFRPVRFGSNVSRMTLDLDG